MIDNPVIIVILDSVEELDSFDSIEPLMRWRDDIEN